jgi:glutathione S-transferase
LRAHPVLQPPGRAPLPEARGRSRRADKAEREQLPGILDYLEQVAPEDGYLVGDTITLADIAVASPFVNLGHIGVESRRPPQAARLSGPHPRSPELQALGRSRDGVPGAGCLKPNGTKPKPLILRRD